MELLHFIYLINTLPQILSLNLGKLSSRQLSREKSVMTGCLLFKIIEPKNRNIIECNQPIQQLRQKYQKMNKQKPIIKCTNSVLYYQPPTNKNNGNNLSQDSVTRIVDEAFKMFDKNHSNQLDTRQFSQFIDYAIKTGLMKPTVDHIFLHDYLRGIDKNNDGLISRSQLYSYLSKILNKPNQKQNKVNQQKKYIPVHKNEANHGNSGNHTNNNNNTYENINLLVPMICEGLMNNRNKRYSQAQIVDMVEQAFMKYDANKTGQLDYVQLSNYLKHEWNNQFSYSDVVKVCDANGNRLINRNQLFVFLKNKLTP